MFSDSDNDLCPMTTLPFQINIKHGYSIIGTFSPLHGLIQNYMFINFEENILYSWLFGPTHGIYSMDKCNALQQARLGFCTRCIGQTWFLNSGIQPTFHALKQTEVTWAQPYYKFHGPTYSPAYMIIR